MASNPIKNVSSNDNSILLSTKIDSLGLGRYSFTIKYKSIELAGIITQEKNIHGNYFEDIFIGNHNTYANERIPLNSKGLLTAAEELLEVNGIILYLHKRMIAKTDNFKVSWAGANDDKGNFIVIENTITHDEANLYFTYDETVAMNKAILNIHSSYNNSVIKKAVLTGEVNF